MEGGCRICGGGADRHAPGCPADQESKESTKRVEWKKPDVYKEEGEVMRVAELFTDNEEGRMALAYAMKTAIENAELEDLTDEFWATLTNTESNKINLGDIEDANMYGRHYEKGWREIVKGMESGEPIYAPIIFVPKDGSPHLVAGNTRLTQSKARGHRPKVVIIRESEITAE